MRTRRLFLIAAVPLLLLGCGSGTKNAASTNPAPKVTQSHSTQAATSTFTSASLAPGLAFTLPDASWTAHESLEGLEITIRSSTQPGTLRLFKNMIPTHPDGSKVSAANTPAAMAAALRHQRFLVTTAPVTHTLGKASWTTLDIRAPANQAREFLLVYRGMHYGVSQQVTRGQTVRLCFAAVSTPTGRDTLISSVVAPTADFGVFASNAESILASLTFPDSFTPAA